MTRRSSNAFRPQPSLTQGSHSQNGRGRGGRVTFANTKLTEGSHDSKNPPEQGGRSPASMQTKPPPNPTSTYTSKAPESEHDKARRIAIEKATEEATEATRKAQIASAVASGLATNNTGKKSQEPAKGLVEIAKQAVEEEAKNEAMAKQAPEVEKKGLFLGLFSFFTAPPTPPSPTPPSAPPTSLSIFDKLTKLLTTETSQKAHPTSEVPPPTAEQNTVLDLFYSFTKNIEAERIERAKQAQAQPIPEQTPTQLKIQLEQEGVRQEFAESAEQFKIEQETKKAESELQFLNASDPQSFLHFASQHERTQNSSKNNSFTLRYQQPCAPQTSTSSKTQIDLEHQKLWESVFPELAEDTLGRLQYYGMFCKGEEYFKIQMWKKFHEIKKELTPHNMDSPENTAKIANFKKLLEHEKSGAEGRKETVKNLKTQLNFLKQNVESDYKNLQAKETAEKKVELEKLWLDTIGKYDNYGSQNKDEIKRTQKVKFQTFYDKKESAEIQLKLTCQALSFNCSLNEEQMQTELQKLRKLMEGKNYGTERIDVLEKMEKAKTEFQKGKYPNVGQDAGELVQNTQLQLSFAQELIKQNGKYEVDLSDMQKELYGDRYKIGKGLKADISTSGGVNRRKSPNELQRNEIQLEQDSIKELGPLIPLPIARAIEASMMAKVEFEVKVRDKANSVYDWLSRRLGGSSGKGR